ncbi:MAG: transposase [Deltaproteobacteria bacterium]|nr:transposase [Deltaproteobacteria bacterium]
MSRPLRIQYPDAWYHVMNRGRRGDPIFIDDTDYRSFIDILQTSVELWKVNIAAYCLMSNHYHLLIQTPKANLSRCMRHINGVYTQRFNKTHACDGPLFRGRYRSILVDFDSYLLELVRYIHRNPVRAGIADTMDKYPWSSHQGYLSDAKKWDWLYKDFVLSLFCSNKRERKREYRIFVSYIDSEELEKFYCRKKISAMFGKEPFRQWVKNTFSGEKRDVEIPESRIFMPDVGVIKKQVCALYGIDEAELLRSRRGVNNEPRNVAIYLTRYLRGDGLEVIGQAFGMDKYSSVSSVIERTKALIADNTRIKKRVDMIKSKINMSQEQT